MQEEPEKSVSASTISGTKTWTLSNTANSWWLAMKDLKAVGTPVPLPTWKALLAVVIFSLLAILGSAPIEMSAKAVCPEDWDAQCQSCVPCLAELRDWANRTLECKCKFHLDTMPLRRLKIEWLTVRSVFEFSEYLLRTFFMWYPWQLALAIPARRYTIGSVCMGLFVTVVNAASWAIRWNETPESPFGMKAIPRALYLIPYSIRLLLPLVLYFKAFMAKVQSRVILVLAVMALSLDITDTLLSRVFGLGYVGYAVPGVYVIVCIVLLFKKIRHTAPTRCSAYVAGYYIAVYTLPWVLLRAFQMIELDATMKLVVWFVACTLCRLSVALIIGGAFGPHEQIAMLFPMQLIEDLVSNIQILGVVAFSDKYWQIAATLIVWELVRDAFLGRTLRALFRRVSVKVLGTCGCCGVLGIGALGIGGAASGLGSELTVNALGSAASAGGKVAGGAGQASAAVEDAGGGAVTEAGAQTGAEAGGEVTHTPSQQKGVIGSPTGPTIHEPPATPPGLVSAAGTVAQTGPQTGTLISDGTNAGIDAVRIEEEPEEAEIVDMARKALLAHEKQYLKDTQNVVGELLSAIYGLLVAVAALVIPDLQYSIDSTPEMQVAGLGALVALELIKACIVFVVNRRFLDRDIQAYIAMDRSSVKGLLQPMSILHKSARGLELLHLSRFDFWFALVASWLVLITAKLMRTSTKSIGPL